jgi:hypothetical protein
MPPPSMARDFFEQIRTAPDHIAFIRGLVNSAPPTYETDWLDFKQQPSANLKDPKWREMWVEALAGFANNQGGVLIWGIDARKDPTTNIDAACGEKPVDNPPGVKSRLIELQRQATDPPLANVEIEAYEIASRSGTGFVVCFVPEGPHKPYRAEDGRKSQYYVRSGDNFTVLSRSMLQSMFYPRSLAIFRAKASLEWTLPDRAVHQSAIHQSRGITVRDVAQLRCKLELLNDGTATARNAHVLVERNVVGKLRDMEIDTEWTFRVTQHGTDFVAPRPLHPGWHTPLFVETWIVEAASSPATDYMVVPTCPAPAYTLSIFCENQERQVIKIEFDTAEMLAHREGCNLEASPVE